ncbi:MAG: S-methyl-5'-thioinosine phosphorylase [Gammaproteobacteria bacterium]|nr:S-methyl-5'-thioinosine phosphorylase [Gammaproteobacteria bacterium]
MAKIGIIGGSGLASLHALDIERREMVHTPYGEPSGPYSIGTFDGLEVIFQPRHGAGHTIPPHALNYRANIWGLRELGAEKIIGMAAVGGITANMCPGSISVPDQIIDYTHSRKHTYFDDDRTPVTHIDFTEPYCEALRQSLLKAGENTGIQLIEKATYAATQGPRLETAAEINRLENDGCDIVGMTGMPEAALASELGLCYACCAVTVNWAAGRSDGPIRMEQIEENLSIGMSNARKVLAALEF